MSTDFKIGDKVIHPYHGEGVIKIESRMPRSWMVQFGMDIKNVIGCREEDLTKPFKLFSLGDKVYNWVHGIGEVCHVCSLPMDYRDYPNHVKYYIRFPCPAPDFYDYLLLPHCDLVKYSDLWRLPQSPIITDTKFSDKFNKYDVVSHRTLGRGIIMGPMGCGWCGVIFQGQSNARFIPANEGDLIKDDTFKLYLSGDKVCHETHGIGRIITVHTLSSPWPYKIKYLAQFMIGDMMVDHEHLTRADNIPFVDNPEKIKLIENNTLDLKPGDKIIHDELGMGKIAYIYFQREPLGFNRRIIAEFKDTKESIYETCFKKVEELELKVGDKFKMECEVTIAIEVDDDDDITAHITLSGVDQTESGSEKFYLDTEQLKAAILKSREKK